MFPLKKSETVTSMTTTASAMSRGDLKESAAHDDAPSVRRGLKPVRERIFIELMTLDRNFKLSREGSK